MLELNNIKLPHTYDEVTELLDNTEALIQKANQLSIKDYGLLNHLELAKQNLLRLQMSIIETQVQTSFKTSPRFLGAYHTISLEEAVSIMKAVEVKAKSMGIAVVIAVYNKEGNPIAMHSMEGAYLASFDIAMNKAYTSSALKMSTSELKKLAQPGGSLYGIQNTNQGKIVIFGGGEVLIREDAVIGSIGVSGGTEEEDAYLAQFGKEKFKEVT